MNRAFSKTFSLILMSICFVFHYSASAQSDTTYKECLKYLNKGFVSDGQGYYLRLAYNEPASLNISFYNDMIYRLVICRNEKQKIKIVISDDKKKVIFSDLCEVNERYWDLEFKSMVNCIISIEEKNPDSKPENIRIAIGFKQKKRVSKN